MSEMKYKIILLSSILVPDDELLKCAIDHDSKSVFSSGQLTPIDSIDDALNSYDDLIAYIAYMCDVDPDYVCKHAQRYIGYVFILSTDAMLSIYRIDTNEKSLRKCISTKDPEAEYTYIGILSRTRSDNIVYGMVYAYGYRYSDILETLRANASENDVITMYKISNERINDPTYTFLSNPNMDHAYYDSIKANLPKDDPVAYYDYCMRLIWYEKTVYNVKDGTTRTSWEYMDWINKSFDDFLNPKTFEEMIKLDRPILWERKDFK